HTISTRDWSSDVCSSDLVTVHVAEEPEAPALQPPDPEPPSVEPEPVLAVSEAPSLDIPTEEPVPVYPPAYSEEPAVVYSESTQRSEEHTSELQSRVDLVC